MKRLLLALFLANVPWAPASDANLSAPARLGLERATAFLTGISTHGGYLWRYSLDLKLRAGETAATATQVWIQPPGTPSVGMAFLRAHAATGEARFLQAAREAAACLAEGQLESGGWDYLIEFDPQRAGQWRRRIAPAAGSTSARPKNTSTYDDNTTQSALRFLLAFTEAAKSAPDPRDDGIRVALDYGLKKLIEAQYPNGAWPQRWDGRAHPAAEFPVQQARFPATYPREHPKQNYYGYYTLNDGAQRDLIQTLLEAWRRTGRRDCLDAARRGAGFLLLAQLPEPQPVWAQQYDAQMEPAWARAFEPPAVTGDESIGAMHALLDVYQATGEQRFLAPLPAALAWFDRSALPGGGRWARYYELQTNKPIYGDRDGKIYYRLQDISEERQKGYSWSGEYGLAKLRQRYEKIRQAGPPDPAAYGRTKPPSDRERASRVRSLAPRVQEILAAQDASGRWITHGQVHKRDWSFDDRIETELFIKNMATLSDYLEAAR